MRGFESKHWGWWYLCIGLCFLLLATVHLLRGTSLAAVAIRIAVALGFVLLAALQFRSRQ